jgi:hypothetical protein
MYMVPAKIAGFTINAVDEAVHSVAETHTQKEERWRKDYDSKKHHREEDALVAAQKKDSREKKTESTLGKIAVAIEEGWSEVLGDEVYDEEDEMDLFGETKDDKYTRKERKRQERLNREGLNYENIPVSSKKSNLKHSMQKVEDDLYLEAEARMWEDEECAPGFVMVTVSFVHVFFSISGVGC